MFRRFTLLAFLLAFGIGCAPRETFTYRQVVMGVEARITLAGVSETTAKEAARAAFARLEQLENVMSDYREDSELMRLTRSPGTPVEVSGDLFTVLEVADTMRRETDGAFDVTAGPLTQLWRQARNEGRAPRNEAIAAARARVGGEALVVQRDRGTVLLLHAEMQLDLGGIGKGFAAQEAVRTLRDCGCPRALVAIAGDIAAGDPPPGLPSWRVATNDGEAIALQNSSVSTSGDTEQFMIINGVRHSHVVDIRTGFGSTLQLEATVTGPNGAIVDALSSALVVRPIDEGMEILQRFPAYEARIVRRAEDGTTSVRATPGWRQLVRATPPSPT